MPPKPEQLGATSVGQSGPELTLRSDDSAPSFEASDDAGVTTTRFAPVIAASATPPFTPYHAKYLAYELTKRVGADQADKLAQSLSNATVDSNPHQVDAALFAFRSPLSRGAILADEVGLGKTIEAGIIISQLWAEKKRRILVIVPASLRKQWSSELADKFFIPSFILESKSFRELLRKMPSPFQKANQVVICSYHFARAKAAEVTAVPWDLVVIDEAHRLRNVYKKDNKIARALRDPVRGRPKVLLTATPLQNSLMELYVQISTTLHEARTKLLENFDEDVQHKLRLRQKETRQRLDRYEDWLWALTATELAGQAEFDFEQHCFSLRQVPAGLAAGDVPLGRYRLQPPQQVRDRGGEPDTDFHYRPGHPLAEGLIARAKDCTLPPRELILDYERRGARIMLVEQLRGESGWLHVEQLTVASLDTEETLLITGVTDDGRVLDRETCEKLLTIPATLGSELSVDDTAQTRLESAVQSQANRVLIETQSRNETFFDAESDKLDSWADDLKENLERELKNIELAIREAKKAKRLAADLQSKIEAQKKVNELEQQRNQKKRTLFDAQDQIEQRKDTLISEVEARLQQQTSRQNVFTIKWRLA